MPACPCQREELGLCWEPSSGREGAEVRTELATGPSTEPSAPHSPVPQPQTTQTRCFLPPSKPSSSPAPAQHWGSCSLARAAEPPSCLGLKSCKGQIRGKQTGLFFFSLEVSLVPLLSSLEYHLTHYRRHYNLIYRLSAHTP